MRVARVVLSFILVFVSSPRLSSQQTTSTPQRDPRAISVLSQLVTATGWGPSPLPGDAVISATATKNVGETQSTTSLAVKVRGCHEFRVDANDTDGSRST